MLSITPQLDGAMHLLPLVPAAEPSRNAERLSRPETRRENENRDGRETDETASHCVKSDRGKETWVRS